MPRRAAPRKPQAEGWFHPLDRERMEVFLRLTDDKGDSAVKIRASGPESEMGELIDWFERVTGLTVNVPETKWRRLHRGPRPVVGQQAMFEAEPVEMTQLSSQDATVRDDG